MIPNFHHVLRCRLSSCVVVVKIRWRWKIKVIEQVVVHGVRAPIPMWCLELIKQHEGLFGIALLGKPINAVVFDHLGRMPCLLHQRIHPIDAKLRIEIGPLPSPIDQHLRVVKSRWRCPQVPFANDCSLVSVLLKHLRKGEEVSIEVSPIYILVKAIDMAELSRQDGRTTRATDAVCAVHLVHARPILGDAINVGRWSEGG